MGTLDNRDQLITALRQQLAEKDKQLTEARAEVERLKAEQEALASVGATAIIRRCELTEQLVAQAAELERLREAAEKVVKSQGLGELADAIVELRKETEA